MGDNTRYWLTGFAATMVTGLSITGVMCEQTLAYYLAVGLTAAHLGNQVCESVIVLLSPTRV